MSQLERFYHKLSHSPRVVVAVVVEVEVVVAVVVGVVVVEAVVVIEVVVEAVVVAVVAWHRSYSRVVPFSSANCVSL